MAHTLTWRQIDTTLLYNEMVQAGACTDKRDVTLRVFAPDRLVGDAMEFNPNQAVELQGIGREAADRVLHRPGVADRPRRADVRRVARG